MEQMFNDYGDAVCNYIGNLIVIDKIKSMDKEVVLNLKLKTYSDRKHSVILEE